MDSPPRTPMITPNPIMPEYTESLLRDDSTKLGLCPPPQYPTKCEKNSDDTDALNNSAITSQIFSNVSILKALNDEILTFVVDKLIFNEENIAKLMEDNNKLRQLIKEMHDHEPVAKEELLTAIKVKETNFAKILQQKEQEYEELRQAYEELSERGGSNQEVSKLQTKLKFMETRLKSVQMQLDNKTKENEELSNMMNELCGQQV